MTRRRTLAFGLLAALGGAGCGHTPPTHWYALRSELPPEASGEGAAPAAADAAEVWELSPRVALPGALDRDTLQVASGDAGVQPLAGHRWAEPLRDALPRLLLHDLSRRRGGNGRVWLAPAPAGVAALRRLQVEVLALQADAERRVLKLHARWWFTTLGQPAEPPRLGEAAIEVGIAGPSVDALAAAHRLALWRLSGRIAAA